MLDAGFFLGYGVVGAVLATLVAIVTRPGWARTILRATTIVYVAAVIGLTMTPLPIDANVIAEYGHADDGPLVNLVPTASIAEAWARRWDYFVLQVGGNVVMTVPLGTLLALWFRGAGVRAQVTIGMGAILGIECAQLLGSLALGGRFQSFDVDDIILNAAGLAIGLALWRVVVPWLGRHIGPVAALRAWVLRDLGRRVTVGAGPRPS